MRNEDEDEDDSLSQSPKFLVEIHVTQNIDRFKVKQQNILRYR